jgi:ABC-type branched-subunit amino acid transport system permease subunit
MTQQLLSNPERERPALLLPIIILGLGYAVTLCVCGVLSFAGRMPFHLGAQLIGSGLEVMGPTPYFLYAMALIAAGVGLLRRQNWARLLLIIVCAAGIVFLVPHISSAVIDERYAAMSLDGLQILIRVVTASYMWREREWFIR